MLTTALRWLEVRSARRLQVKTQKEKIDRTRRFIEGREEEEQPEATEGPKHPLYVSVLAANVSMLLVRITLSASHQPD